MNDLPDRNPLTAFAILVDSEHNLSAVGIIQSDGTYKLTTTEDGDGAVLGDHQVSVVVRPKVDRDLVRNPPPVMYS